MRRAWKWTGIGVVLAAAAAFVAAWATGGLGLHAVRWRQDWSEATDPRFRLVCHVGNWGSGVLVACDGTGADVLTCAHLAEEGETPSIRFHDPATGRWVAYAGRVVRRSHPHKEDLALLRVDTESFHLPPWRVEVGTGPPAGAVTRAQIVNAAFGAEARPFLLDLPAVATVTDVSSYLPDASGAREWKVGKVVVHGGVLQANSGSPVFEGGRLVGLVESAPAVAKDPDGRTVIGIAVTAPADVAAFLAAPGGR